MNTVGKKYIINIIIGLMISIVVGIISMILIVSEILSSKLGATLICATFLVLFIRPLVYNTIIGVVPILGNLSSTVTASIDIWFYHKNNKNEKVPNLLAFVLLDVIHWVICISIVIVLFCSPKLQEGCVNYIYNILKTISVLLNNIHNKPILSLIYIFVQIVLIFWIIYILSRLILGKLKLKTMLFFTVFSVLNTAFQSYFLETGNFIRKIFPLMVYSIMLILSNSRATPLRKFLFFENDNGEKRISLWGVPIVITLSIIQIPIKMLFGFGFMKYVPYILYLIPFLYIIYRILRGTFKGSLITGSIVVVIFIQLFNCWILDLSFTDIIKRYLFIWILEGLPYIKALINKTQNP